MSSTRRTRSPTSSACTSGHAPDRAAIATRIRLADSQRVIAIAEMSDGSFWSDEMEVIVTLAACLEVL